MKTALTIICILMVNVCNAQIDIEKIYEKEKGDNLGKCFVSHPLDTNNRKTYYLQFIPAEYETHQVKVDEAFAKKLINPERINSPYTLNLPINRAFSDIVLVEKHINCMSMVAYETGKSFCLVEIPVRYIKMEKSPIVNNGDTSYTIIDKTIDAKKMIKPSEIKVYKSKRKANPDFPIYEMKGGEWSEWKEVVCYPEPEVKIEDIQQALIKLGYDLEINGVLAKKDKDALIDFQKKNNLVQRRLDMTTLEALGLILPEKY